MRKSSLFSSIPLSPLLSAEQKRRGTIKNGFEFLRALVPSLSQTPNVKISKAALLTKVCPTFYILFRFGSLGVGGVRHLVNLSNFNLSGS